MRVRVIAALSLTALLLAAYAALANPPLQAQTTPQTTTTTLVSNIDSSGYRPQNGIWISGVLAQSITTGPDTAGYPILEVRLFLRAAAGRSTNIMIKEDDNGEPGALVAALTNPDRFTDLSLITFTAPEGTTLDPDTTYWITVNEGLADGVRGVTPQTTSSNNDAGEIGWSIGDEHLKQLENGEDWGGWTNTLYIEIKSTEGAVAASSDASLRSMYIHPSPLIPGSGGQIRLRPNFSPNVTDYTAKAVNWIDRVTVSIYKRDVRASTVFSRGQWPNREDYASFDLEYGSSTLTVTVTAEDGSTKTYTITLNRSADPPEPTDCPTGATWCATMAAYYFRSNGVTRDGALPRLFEGAGYSVYGVVGDMSSRTFDHGGRRYTVLRLDWYRQSSRDGLTVYSDYLQFGTEPALPFGSVLQVDNRTFTLDGDNDTRHPGHHSWWIRSNPFDWALGDHVTLSLKLPDSDNAKLRDLALTDADGDPITLTPDEFDRNVADYTALVSNEIESVTLSATASDSNATIAITNDDDTSTPDKAVLDLSVGSNNDFTVRVTSQSGDSRKTYTVNVTRSATQLQTANNPATGGPAISGTAQVGETLTATTLLIDDADGLENASYSYQWARQDLATSASRDISGATGSTYTVSPDDRNRFIRVTVSFADDAGNDETLTSYWLFIPPPANNPATGAPTINGTAEVGETLTADTSTIADSDGLTNVAYRYQWLADDGNSVMEISGATYSTYTLAAADAGKTIKLKVSFTDDADHEEALRSSATDIVSFAVQQQTANNSATGAPRINGTAQVGETLTVDTSTIADSDGLTNVAYRYQWLANDGNSVTDISGATYSTYTLAAVDAGRTIQVHVSFTDDAGNEEALSSEATASVRAPRTEGSAPDTPHLATGTAVFIGAVDLVWDDAPGADSYDVQLYGSGRWIDLPGDGVAIALYGAGAIISELDPETSLWLRVRAANAHGISDWSNIYYMASTSQFKLGRRARPANLRASGAPVINGTAQVGATLWADTAEIEDGNGLDRVQFQYQWTSNDGSADTDIAGATDSTYTWSDADAGKTIKVRVSFTDRGGYAESLTSAALATVATAPAINNPATGAPRINGTAEVGETLTANTSSIADADGLTNVAYKYQWLANDGNSVIEISGATDSTYTLAAADAGTTIKVQVSFTDDAGNEEALTSSATDTVSFAVQQQTANNPATGAPRINGTAEVGETLTANTSTIADADGLTNVAYKYQWLANDGNSVVEISGATDSTYTLAAADEGNTIKVQVSFTDDADNEETLTSEPTNTVAELPRPPLTASLSSTPESHDGQSQFSFELRFSEELRLSYRTLKFDAFTVTGGTVTRAQRIVKRSNIGWRITVEPYSNSAIRILLPASTDCDATGAICTTDGRRFSSPLELSVSGPSG